MAAARRSLVALATAAFVGAVAIAPTQARADSITDLGPIGFASMVVDNAHGRVFVAGLKRNVIDVLNLSGKVLAKIRGVGSPYAMAINGESLYISQFKGAKAEIRQVNLETLQLDETPVATGLGCPTTLAIIGETLWTTNRPHCSEEGTLVAVNLETGATSSTTERISLPWFAASPADPQSLFVAEGGRSPGTFYRFDVSTGTPELLARNVTPPQANITQIVLSPDGERLIPAAAVPYHFEELNALTLQPDGVEYPGEMFPSAVAVSGGEANRLATGVEGGSEPGAPDIWVAQLGNPTPIFSASTTDLHGRHSVASDGLALTGDGHELFAVYYSETFTGHTMLATFALPKT
jgi:hypothetical protein